MKNYNNISDDDIDEIDDRLSESLTPEKADISNYLDNPPPEEEYLIHNLLISCWLLTLSAPGGFSKSFLALMFAEAIATGVPLFGNSFFSIPKKGKVVFLTMEEDTSDIHRRLWQSVKLLTAGKSKEEVKEIRKLLKRNLKIPPIAGTPFTLFPDEGKRSFFALIRFLKKYSDIRLLILDPMNLLMTEDLCDNSAVSKFVQLLKKIHNFTGASILILTHSNKQSMQKNSQSHGDTTSVLGAASLVNASRVVMTLSAPSKDFLNKQKLFSCKDKYVLLRTVKCNNMAEKRTLLLERLEGGILKDIPIDFAQEGDVYNTDGLLKIIQTNPGIGKMNLLKTYQEENSASRSDAETILNEAISKKMVTCKRGSRNNSHEYYPIVPDKEFQNSRNV
ncbi:MAG: AAA family ATPase [Candidatus Riflebacteria bacterium]|nr:AAA family ATPase [Candidatus Riflebacteria bacterium]